MMKKLNIFAVIMVGVLFFSGFVFAEDIRNKHNGQPKPVKEIRENLKEKRQEVRASVKEKREEVRSGIRETKEEIRERTKEATRTFKEDLSQKREELKTKIEQKREEVKTRVETKKEELKKRLEKIKDEKKKQAVERIDGQMDALNDRMLKHYMNVLGKLDDVLVRISERTDKFEERDIDVAKARTAISVAKDAIVAARTAIENQAGKTYTIQITMEEGLKTDVGRARQALHADLTVVNGFVKSAHEAVRNVATMLAQLPKPTPTASVAPTLIPSISE